MTRFALLFSLLLPLAACDSSGIVGPGDPDPARITLTLDWDVIKVIGDCEGRIPASNTGDFEFEVTVLSDLDGETSQSVIMDRESNPNTGDNVTVSNGTPTFAIREGQSAQVEVVFKATENDPTGPDSDMNGRRGSQLHAFDSDRWSNLGDRRIRLGSDSGCQVELRYEASASAD